MAPVVAVGAPVRGGYAWTRTDNVERSYGYRPHFGLTHVDYGGQRRTMKRTGEAYAAITRGGRWAGRSRFGAIPGQGLAAR